MTDAAVIFDVDGVMLQLTRDEEELFFKTFEPYLDKARLSRDWNSYRIRNDENIIEEILELNKLSADLKSNIIKDYLNLLTESLKAQAIQTVEISGIRPLLSNLSRHARLGIATANLRDAARLRLEAVGLWESVKTIAFGADGGGHKSEILARVIAAINLPRSRIVYLGDNLNDMIAGHENAVHFIGFSNDPERREKLRSAGATHVTAHHADNLSLIRKMLMLD
jgi:HAD superfamily hydrolase (TIGR01549 family)